jgi:ABC-type uncharacterized transport system auxiliary subunit
MRHHRNGKTVFKGALKILFLYALLQITACGSIPEPNYYTLSFPESLENNGSNQKTFTATIGFSKFESGLLLKDDRIIYRQSDYEIKFWHYQRWIAQPNILVSEFLIEYLKSHKIFTDVVKFPSQTRVKYVMGGKLLAFEEWDKDGQWYGKVAFDVYLRDYQNDRIVWQNHYEKMLPVQQKLPIYVVAAISQALHDCFDNLGNDLRNDLDVILSN